MKKETNKLLEMTEVFPHCELWTDSFAIEDHIYGLSNGTKGITTSPTWVSKMMCLEPFEEHREIISKLHTLHPEYNEMELTWAWTLEMGKQRKGIMLPLWEKGAPRQGRFSIQTSIYEYNNYERMLTMAREVASCGSNMQVKIPCTEAGIRVIEQATYEGISCMGTQCFSVDQSVACCAAIERALDKREKKGSSNAMINPMIALLPGMQDESIKAVSESEGLAIHPDALNWAGIAIAKKSIRIIEERKYRTRPLIAYYRNMLHWREFIGGDLAMTIPVKWQKRFVSSDVVIKDYFHEEPEEWILDELLKVPLFSSSYNEGSLQNEDFVSLPQVTSTFSYFTSEYQKAVEKVRSFCLNYPL